MGWGWRGGWGSSPAARPAPEDEAGFLRSQAELLGRELKAVQDRIAALGAGAAEEGKDRK
jgi:hypothetical protein